MDKKIYKNSECEKCGTYESNLKLKESPIDGEIYIYCKECFAKEYKKVHNEDKNTTTAN